MKKIFLILIILSVFTGCKDPDNAIYQVFDNVEHGAALRKKAQDPELSSNFNIFDLQSTWEVVVEEQDEEKGALLDKVNVYVSFVDKFNTDGVNNKAETLIKTIPASDFDTSDAGLPITHIIVSFEEALNALGIVAGEYNGGDEFPIRLELVLTDGRTFSADSSSDSLQQSYWSSPFAYISKILCLPDSPVTGDYVIKMHDSYGDGWQGSKIVITVDGVENEAFINSEYDAGSVPPYDNVTTTFTVPVGANTVTWSFVKGAYPSEVSFEIYGPNSGEVIGEFGPTPSEGTLSLNYCAE